MEQIVYISTSRTEPDQAMLDDILGASRRNNRRDGLTGLLVVGGRRFLQVIEGPAEVCEATYARIRADTRHFALVQLSRRAIEERSFGSWDMGCEQGSQYSLIEAVGRLTDRLTDPYLKAQFLSFAQLHSEPA